jgi:hypothetical protein
MAAVRAASAASRPYHCCGARVAAPAGDGSHAGRDAALRYRTRHRVDEERVYASKREESASEEMGGSGWGRVDEAEFRDTGKDQQDAKENECGTGDEGDTGAGHGGARAGPRAGEDTEQAGREPDGMGERI